MKEDMFDVLMYLFENHMQSDCKLHLDEEVLMTELKRAGFNPLSIDSALGWLEGLLFLQENVTELAKSGSSRVYTPYEVYKLNTDVRGFLTSLQQDGILNTMTHELVIDRLMAIEEQRIGLPQAKWVTLLVLFNQPNEDIALACMEILVLKHTAHGLH